MRSSMTSVRPILQTLSCCYQANYRSHCWTHPKSPSIRWKIWSMHIPILLYPLGKEMFPFSFFLSALSSTPHYKKIKRFDHPLDNKQCTVLALPQHSLHTVYCCMMSFCKAYTFFESFIMIPRVVLLYMYLRVIFLHCLEFSDYLKLEKWNQHLSI